MSKATWQAKTSINITIFHVYSMGKRGRRGEGGGELGKILSFEWQIFKTLKYLTEKNPKGAAHSVDIIFSL